MKFIDVFHLF